MGKKRPAPSDAQTKPGDSSDGKGAAGGDARKKAQETQVQKPETTVERGLKIEEFMEARAFELQSIQATVSKAKEMAKSRAFQMVPRHLRRRAASYNPKLVPKHLRDRAKKEIASDPPKTPKKAPRKHQRKVRFRNSTADFEHRQKNGLWLETHLWHIKRFHMTTQWGYKIPETPMQKCARAFYRASKNLATITDLSYWSVYEFRGPQRHIVDIVSRITDPLVASVGSARFLDGRRVCHTTAYAYNMYPAGMLGPTTALWQPLVDAHAEHTGTLERALWMWVHPAYEEQFVDTLRACIAALGYTDVFVSDIDGMVRFSLGGPRCHAVLQAVLQLADSSADSGGFNESAHQVWTQLKHLSSPGSLGSGIVLGLTAWDPRLSFPPLVPRRNVSVSDEERSDIHAILTKPWSAELAASSLWDSAARDIAASSQLPEKKLNSRRHEHLVPGTKLTPLPGTDTRVPLLLIQRSAADIGCTLPKETKDLLVGWDLILPKSWGLPFWRSLFWAGARPGGLRELQAMHFECGLPFFPVDFPGTAAHTSHTTEKALVDQHKWVSRGTAKRPNFTALGVEEPWNPSWRNLTDRLKAQATATPLQSSPPPEPPETWACDLQPLQLLRHPLYLQTLIHTVSATDSAALWSQVCDLVQQQWSTSIPTAIPASRQIDTDKLPISVFDGLVPVRIRLPGRGIAKQNAMIYCIPTKELYKECHQVLQHGFKEWSERRMLTSLTHPAGAKQPAQSHRQAPAKENIVGYVTHGGYSLAQGCSVSTGCIAASGLIKILLDSRAAKTLPMVLVRGTTHLETSVGVLEFF
ncbi:Ribonucleases P/MRP protein subunit pop1 [Sorochytrium milnesiophthora]